MRVLPETESPKEILVMTHLFYGLCPYVQKSMMNSFYTHEKSMKIKLRLSLTSQKVQKIKFACLSCFSTMSHLFQMETFLKQIFSVASVTGQVDKAH